MSRPQFPRLDGATPTPTSTDWNLGADAADFAQQPPAGVMTRTGAVQSIGSGAFVTVIFDTEAFDNDGMINLGSSTTHITISEAGLYQASSYVAIASNVTGYRIITILQNNVTQIFNATNAVNGNNSDMCISGTLVCAAGDTISVQVKQSSGSTLTTDGTPRLSVAYLTSA